LEKTAPTETTFEACSPVGEKTLPAWCYTSKQWFDREKKNLFNNAWHFICLASCLDEGDFLTRTILGNNIIVLRDRDNTIKAFYNSCRHRGAPITDQKKGNVNSLICPYHKWSYDLKGNLLSANGLSSEVKRRCADNLNLKEIPLEIANNLVFINFSSVHEPLNAYLGDYIESIAKPHRTDKMRCIHSREYVLNSNWKLYVEVDMETLHTPCIHSDSIGKQPVEILKGNDQWIGVFHRSDVSPALKPTLKGKGFPYTEGIYGEALNGTHFCVILPGFFIVTAQDCMWWIQKTPISESQVAVHVGYCFPEETLVRPDYDEISQHYIDRWNQVIAEDDWITEYQQKGLNENVSGIYTDKERVVQHFDRMIVAKVLETPTEVLIPSTEHE
jgi:phenylpropionate dioxygenase-like ring-hydroxylating dioxygenase large terminal subunit